MFTILIWSEYFAQFHLFARKTHRNHSEPDSYAPKWTLTAALIKNVNLNVLKFLRSIQSYGDFHLVLNKSSQMKNILAHIHELHRVANMQMA